MPIIDSHQHFWRYNDPEEFGWIPPDWHVLKRDHLPSHLEEETKSAGVDGVIAVQARQSLAETEWLLHLASQRPFIRGVVGWAPLASPTLESSLERLSIHPAARKLRALRHVLQAESDGYMLSEGFNRGVRLITRLGYAYDLLVVARQLPRAIEFADCHDNATLILDHLGKPEIAIGGLARWSKDLRELARRSHVVCKISGMVTEANPREWTSDELRPYFDVALDAFGPKRLLWGSDWPVCLAGVSYARWAQIVQSWLAELSQPEREAVLGANAERVYRLI